MTARVSGIHHVTAICGAPQVNLDFYVGTLGLRLVKRTVNFDDPSSYHLYYGDEDGRPGTLLTFFPWPGALPGRIGAGMVGATAFAAAPGSTAYWVERLKHLAHEYLEPRERFGGQVLALHDPDGLPLEIVEQEEAGARPGWEAGPVEPEFRLRSFHGVTLHLEDFTATSSVLTTVLGLEEIGEEAGRLRFGSTAGKDAHMVDLVREDETARQSAGTVHHVAFRARDAAHQADLCEQVREAGLFVTDVKDRKYFQSVYFREPGGVLFEIATDSPGMAVDEDPERLGSRLSLPSSLESRRIEIERRLPQIAVPG